MLHSITNRAAHSSCCSYVLQNKTAVLFWTVSQHKYPPFYWNAA